MKKVFIFLFFIFFSCTNQITKLNNIFGKEQSIISIHDFNEILNKNNSLKEENKDNNEDDDIEELIKDLSENVITSLSESIDNILNKLLYTEWYFVKRESKEYNYTLILNEYMYQIMFNDEIIIENDLRITDNKIYFRAENSYLVYNYDLEISILNKNLKIGFISLNNNNFKG